MTDGLAHRDEEARSSSTGGIPSVEVSDFLTEMPAYLLSTRTSES